MTTTIVVHDPVDEHFKKVFKREYQYLHEKTGDKHLFVSFMQPDKGQEYKATYDCELAPNSLSYEKKMDNEVVIMLLCNFLKIEDVKPPFLLLTTSLRNKSFYVVPTSADLLVRHLEQITYFCMMCNENTALDNTALRTVVKQMTSNVELREISNPIREYLLRLSAPFHTGNSKKKALQYIEKVTGIQNDGSFRIVHHRDGSISCSSMCTTRRERLQSKWLQPIDESINIEAKVNKTAYGMLADLNEEVRFPDLDMRPHWDLNENVLFPDLDMRSHWQYLELKTRANYISLKQLEDQQQYSAAVMNISVAVECELYHSVLQMMRHCIGIEMPLYFLKPELTDEERIFRRGNFSANLNEYNRGEKLKSMALGKMKSIYSKMKESVMQNEAIVLEDRFVSIGTDDRFERNVLYGLTNVRNNVAHYTPGYELINYDEVRENFNTFMNDYIGELIELKRTLRGDANIHTQVG